MPSYSELDITPVLNANATLTRLGGSLMPPEVLEAMMAAAKAFVDLPELQRRVGNRIAPPHPERGLLPQFGRGRGYRRRHCRLRRRHRHGCHPPSA